MEITTARVITTIEDAEIRSGYLILTSEPTDASVYITVKGEERYYGKTPMTGELFPYGSYRYRISKNMYHQESGEVRVENGRVEKHIALQPAFGYLEVKTQPSGAQVIIDGQDKEYTSPCKLQLSSGSYKVRLTKKLYGTSERKVVVKDNEITPLNATLDPKFAHLVVNSLPETSVYVDGKFMGKGPKYEVDLLEGLHEIEVQLASHKTVKKQIEIIAKKNQEISLNPTPIFGALNIKSGSTNDATIFIDNKNYGKAPQVIYEILVGKHTVKLEKAGYESIVKEVVIAEGKMFPFEEKMETRHIPLTVSPSVVKFPANGGIKRITVLPRDGWRIEGDPLCFWLTIKSRDRYVQVKAKKNEYLTRFASFFVSTTTERKKIYIDQKGVDSKPKYKTTPKRKYEFTEFFYGDLTCVVDFRKPWLWGMGLALGGYVKGVNIEATWSAACRNDMDLLNALLFGVKTGYGFQCGRMVSITPQIGLGWRGFENFDYYLNGYRGFPQSLSLEASLRLSIGGDFPLHFIIVPEYSYTLLGKYYPLIVTPTSYLCSWRHSFGLRFGMSITLSR